MQDPDRLRKRLPSTRPGIAPDRADGALSHFPCAEPIRQPSRNRAARSAFFSSSDDSKGQFRDAPPLAHGDREHGRYKNDNSNCFHTTFHRREPNSPSGRGIRSQAQKSSAPSIPDFQESLRPKTLLYCENSASCSFLCRCGTFLRPSEQSVSRGSPDDRPV